jgi:hypothetical protein
MSRARATLDTQTRALDPSSIHPVAALPVVVEVGGHPASLIAIGLDGCTVRSHRQPAQGLVQYVRFVLCESFSMTVPCVAAEVVRQADGTHAVSFRFHLENGDSSDIVAMLVHCIAPPGAVH